MKKILGTTVTTVGNGPDPEQDENSSHPYTLFRLESF
jgi:hypothetical protein